MTFRISGLCAAAAVVLLPASAYSADKPPEPGRFYVGGALGATFVHGDYAGEVTRARAADPAPPTDVNIDTDSGAAGRIFAGMQLTPNFALEADYADLGRLKTHAMWQGVDPFFQFERFGSIKVRAAGLSLLASAPLAGRTSIFARAGAMYTWVDYEVHGLAYVRTPPPASAVSSFPSPTPPKRSGNGTRGVLGLGVSHDLSDRWSVRAEYARYFNLGAEYSALVERGKFDLDLASVEVTFRF